MNGEQNSSETDLVAQFERYALASGARVSHVSSPAAIIELVPGGTDENTKCSAAIRDGFPAIWQALAQGDREPLIAEDIALLEPEPAALAAKLAGGTGLVLARAGVAETGSILLAGDALASRLLSMLVDTCVALLPASAILPDLDAAGTLMEELSASGLPYLSLVTGPSRTADIERVLTIGVQGPKALHILILDEEDQHGG